MRYSRKIGPPIVSAAVATLVLTNFATVSMVKDNADRGIELFGSIWPIALTSAVAVILVMSFLYKSLVDLVDELEAREANAQHQALHDQLTGLANRALLEDRLSQALQMDTSTLAGRASGISRSGEKNRPRSRHL